MSYLWTLFVMLCQAVAAEPVKALALVVFVALLVPTGFYMPRIVITLMALILNPRDARELLSGQWWLLVPTGLLVLLLIFPLLPD